MSLCTCTVPMDEQHVRVSGTLARGRAAWGLKQEARRRVEEELLQRVARGEEAAVQGCIDRYGGLVWSLARRMCGAGEAEDAVQEIFVDLWRSAGRYDPLVASETTFVAMIARRRLIDRQRKAARQPRLADVNAVAVGVSDDRGAERMELAADAAAAVKALEALRPEQQRVLRLSVYQGLSHERIAESTGLPLGTVKTHARRGLMRVREALLGQGVAGESLPQAMDEGVNS